MCVFFKYVSGNLQDESDVLEWIISQKDDESIEDIDREKLYEYIETKEFLAVVWCKYISNFLYYVHLQNLFTKYQTIMCV